VLAAVTSQMTPSAATVLVGRSDVQNGALPKDSAVRLAKLAFDRVDFDALEDAAFVRGLASRAVKVRVERGDLTPIELRVTPWPE
jgi:hypothetical protein